MRYVLRLTSTQYQQLRKHLLFDERESVALIICSRRRGAHTHAFVGRRVVLIPHDACKRSDDAVTWPTEYVDELLKDAHAMKGAIVKIHSHPRGLRAFSYTDDVSDREVLGSIAQLVDPKLPQASAIMMPTGEILARRVTADELGPDLWHVSVVGDDLHYWHPETPYFPDPATMRHAQVFGQGTTDLLGRLSAAVVGCSGTGSIVVEQLSRLGIGRLVLVDPDRIELKNLNRIVNAFRDDADNNRLKVEVLAAAVRRVGLVREVLALPMNLATPEAIRSVAECDVVFGCMDTTEGRHLLNRLSTFYNLPYFDVGIRIDADGRGGIAGLYGAVHYVQPGRSSLLTRGVYDLGQVASEAMRRTSPALYARQLDEGYIRGVLEERPAVISVNTFFAAQAVNEFLARIHPFRNDSNASYATTAANLCDSQIVSEPEGEECRLFSPLVGLGDTEPLLGMPTLS